MLTNLHSSTPTSCEKLSEKIKAFYNSKGEIKRCLKRTYEYGGLVFIKFWKYSVCVQVKV